MSGSDIKSKSNSENAGGFDHTNNYYGSSNPVRTTASNPEPGKHIRHSATASQYGPFEGSEKSHRLLDRINQQKTKLAEDQARQAAKQTARSTQMFRPSNQMEQAWQHVDSNVKKLTQTKNFPANNKRNHSNSDDAASGTPADSTKVAWNSSPDQVGGQIVVRQPALAQQLPYNQRHEPPQIPGPKQNLNHYDSEYQDPQSRDDALWDEEADPVFARTSQISEQRRSYSASRFLGIGLTLVVISAGLYYVVGKVEPLVSELYMLQQQAAHDQEGDKPSVVNPPKDLAEQTIASSISEDDTTEIRPDKFISQLRAHNSAIEEKLRPELSAQSDEPENALRSGVNKGNTAENDKLSVESIAGPAGQNLTVLIKLPADRFDRDGSVTLRGIPDEIMLSAGIRNNRTWTVPIRELSGLTLISDSEFQGPFDVGIELRDSENSITATSFMTVNIEPFQKGNTGNRGSTVLASSETENQTQNLIRGTSIIGAEKNNSRQSELKPQTTETQQSFQHPENGLSPSLKAGLLARGQRLLRDGDIASARLAFAHLANNGNGAGAYALAQTYDPQWMAQKPVHGVHGDVAEAIRWYKLAAELGQDKAVSRIRDLELELR